MIEFKEVTLEDKLFIDQHFKNKCYFNSEFTFANMYVWKKPFKIRWAYIDDCLIILYEKDGKRSVTFPIGRKNNLSALDKIVQYFCNLGEDISIQMLNKEDLCKFQLHCGDQYDIIENESLHDYVYLSEDLINLPGKKYHAKKNHINAFKKLYNYEYRRITLEDVPPCRDLFDRWYDGRRGIADISDDKEAMRLMFSHYEVLGLVGGAIWVDNIPVAVSIGEPLCGQMAVVHVEYADIDYRGSFPIINQEFAKNEWSAYKYINREEDMGIDGLRKAKASYFPVMMIQKYIAVFKK